MNADDSWIGSTIDGRYAISERIARGGMSTVYLARDQRLHRDVAIKVLFPHMAADHKVVQRFEQEARNSALISHPNVVQVTDQGQTRETGYMVMEYVRGATLRTLLKRGPMTPRLALAYTHAIVSGLGAAHRAGLVHRDIKPENVLVSPEGRIKLADFGLARAATHHSGTATLMGTVAYISPELLSGEGADERADIYAVGILLYEMLTGVQPFTGDTPVRVAFQHVNSRVPAPSARIPGLAPALDTLVEEATRADPAQRPKNGDALVTLLEETRARLSPAELDYTPGSPPSGPAVTPAATGHTQALDPAAEEFVDEHQPSTSSTFADTEVHDASGSAPTAVVRSEDFPTSNDADAWDEDITTALSQAHRDHDAQQYTETWSTLSEEDRQTVAELPLPSQLSVVDPETAVQERVPAPNRYETTKPEQPRGLSASRPQGNTKKQRQRPTASLRHPSPTKQGIAIGVTMMVMAILILIGFQLGVSNSIIPPLGGS